MAHVSWFMTIECEFTHESWLNVTWLEFSLLQFSTGVFYTFCNFLQFPQREKVGIFFLFWQRAFMCKHLYHCSFLILWLLSLSLKKKKLSTLSQSFFFFFFFCWIFYCFLVYKRVLHLNFLYVKVYFACRLKNIKKGL